jgi:hypothetical protein
LEVTAISQGYNCEVIGFKYGFKVTPMKGPKKLFGMLSVWSDYITFTPLEDIDRMQKFIRYFIVVFFIFFLVFSIIIAYQDISKTTSQFGLTVIVLFLTAFFSLLFISGWKIYKAFTIYFALYPSKEWEISKVDVIIYPMIRQIKIGNYYFQVHYDFDELYKRLMDFPGYVRVG